MKKQNISMFLRKTFIKRKYRDLLFARVFADKKDLLTLYNALNGTGYKNPDKLDIYGKKRVKLPTPQFVVFYNGQDDIPDEQILKLSDSFIISQNDEDVMLECKAKMLNINYGHNKEVMNACKRLHDYSYFIYCVNENLSKNYMLKEAINRAIDQCIEEDVLADILIKQRSEVFQMVLTRYDKKLHEKTLKEEGYSEGYTAGQKEAEERFGKLILLLQQQNRTEEIALAATDKDYRKKLYQEFRL